MSEFPEEVLIQVLHSLLNELFGKLLHSEFKVLDEVVPFTLLGVEALLHNFIDLINHITHLFDQGITDLLPEVRLHLHKGVRDLFLDSGLDCVSVHPVQLLNLLSPLIRNLALHSVLQVLCIRLGHLIPVVSSRNDQLVHLLLKALVYASLQLLSVGIEAVVQPVTTGAYLPDLLLKVLDEVIPVHLELTVVALVKLVHQEVDDFLLDLISDFLLVSRSLGRKEVDGLPHDVLTLLGKVRDVAESTFSLELLQFDLDSFKSFGFDLGTSVRGDQLPLIGKIELLLGSDSLPSLVIEDGKAIDWQSLGLTVLRQEKRVLVARLYVEAVSEFLAAFFELVLLELFVSQKTEVKHEEVFQSLISELLWLVDLVPNVV